MLRRILPSLLTAFIVITIAAGQDVAKQGKKADDADRFISGPQEGSVIPGPCEVWNVNGPTGKGRYHCLVCEYGFDPVVMVFTPEPIEGRDAAITALIDKLEAAVKRNKESSLRAFVVFLSPDCKRSATEDVDKLVDEVMMRNKLIARLEARAKTLEAVVVACTSPEGPKSYNFNPNAEVTVVFYKKLRVLDNFAYPPGKMTPDDATKIVAKVEKHLKDAKKRPTQKVP